MPRVLTKEEAARMAAMKKGKKYNKTQLVRKLQDIAKTESNTTATRDTIKNKLMDEITNFIHSEDDKTRLYAVTNLAKFFISDDKADVIPAQVNIHYEELPALNVQTENVPRETIQDRDNEEISYNSLNTSLEAQGGTNAKNPIQDMPSSQFVDSMPVPVEISGDITDGERGETNKVDDEGEEISDPVTAQLLAMAKPGNDAPCPHPHRQAEVPVLVGGGDVLLTPNSQVENGISDLPNSDDCSSKPSANIYIKPGIKVGEIDDAKFREIE